MITKQQQIKIDNLEKILPKYNPNYKYILEKKEQAEILKKRKIILSKLYKKFIQEFKLEKEENRKINEEKYYSDEGQLEVEMCIEERRSERGL